MKTLHTWLLIAALAMLSVLVAHQLAHDYRQAKCDLESLRGIHAPECEAACIR